MAEQGASSTNIKRSARINAVQQERRVQQEAADAVAAEKRAARVPPKMDRPRRAAATQPKQYQEVDSDYDEKEERRRRKKRQVEEVDAETDTDEETVKKVKHTPLKRVIPVSERMKRNAIVREEASLIAEKRVAFLHANRHLFIPVLDGDEHATYFDKLSQSQIKRAPASWEEREQPKLVRGEMKDYQLRGLSFLIWLYENGANGILGDEMGLGKTLQTLSLLAYLKERGLDGPFLIICPLSVLSSWMAEIARWTPSLKAIMFHGIAHERERLKQNCNEEIYDLYVTSYEQYEAEQSWFKHSFNWRYVVLDEGHRIKNDQSQLAQSLQGLTSQYRLMLTGTPLQNNLRELWALFHWLYPEVFTPRTAQKFNDSFHLTLGNYDEQMLDDSRKLLERIMIRRLKSTVDLNIPPKEEMTLYVPLAPMQRFWYSRLMLRMDKQSLEDIFPANGKTSSSLEDSIKAEESKILHPVPSRLDTVDSMDVDVNAVTSQMREGVEYAMQHEQNGQWRKLMNLLMQLRKICNHPYMMPNSEPEPFLPGDHLYLNAGKMIVLDKLLTKLRIGGHRTLLFSEFTSMLDILEDYLRHKGISYCRLDGSTARPRRNLDIHLFQREDSRM
ncbi:hypothetical protein HDV00_003166 [Rhizophlyctis rosea]|nr:hypothetical protein HDV00_003166 [Rhizophlyctis rosea]